MSEPTTSAGSGKEMRASTERPLLTFALFAYNQEGFVREAVEAAFAQTYEPLEIVLSDDHSTDRTYDVMREMADGYGGPHRVRARRNEVNYGTAQHVSTVGSQAGGDLVIIAAGDDLSEPHRAARLFEAWDGAGRPVGTVHSAATNFDDRTGAEAVMPLRYGNDVRIDLDWFVRNERAAFSAPTCAYTRELFDRFPPLTGGSLIEDTPLLIRTLLIGDLIGVPESLVRRRTNSGNVSDGFTLANVRSFNRMVHSVITAAHTSLNDVHHLTRGDLSPDQARLVRMLRRRIRHHAAMVAPDPSPGFAHRASVFWHLVRLTPDWRSLRGRADMAARSAGFRKRPGAAR